MYSWITIRETTKSSSNFMLVIKGKGLFAASVRWLGVSFLLDYLLI